MAVVQVGGINVGYELHGPDDGDPVVLLVGPGCPVECGTSCSCRCWSRPAIGWLLWTRAGWASRPRRLVRTRSRRWPMT
jgi:hypothetical protein